MNDLASIQQLEELAVNAWPAAINQTIDGWRLRFHWGVTRRANSVWPNQAGGQLTVTEKLALAEDFYARQGQPACFHICPAAQPDNLDDLLAQRGYTTSGHTYLQITTLSNLLSSIGYASVYPITLTPAFNSAWYAAYCQAEQVEPAAAPWRQKILQHIGPATAFALAFIKGEPAGVGLGVLERGWLGLFNLTTLPEFRRQGVAGALLYALARWGQSMQAERVYLQVMTDNQSALKLYARLGFETLYAYHYRHFPWLAQT
jgi:ribosomal protein S18 acetylase RimI-like enzyme